MAPIRTILASLALALASAFAPAQMPPWPAAWDMASSTLSMMCNASGYTDATFSAQFGVASFDWGNSKKEWAVAKPMTCETNLFKQAAMTRAVAPPSSRVFLYANLVKALPWLESVSALLVDPAYSGFFLRFDKQAATHVPRCDAVTGNCSLFYHDQSQTPAVPTPSNPSPDGVCDGYCDVGAGLPCGEYLVSVCPPPPLCVPRVHPLTPPPLCSSSGTIETQARATGS